MGEPGLSGARSASPPPSAGRQAAGAGREQDGFHHKMVCLMTGVTMLCFPVARYLSRI